MKQVCMFVFGLLLIAGTDMFAGPHGARVQPVDPPESEPGSPGNAMRVYPSFVTLGPGDSVGFTVSDYATNGAACHNLVNFGDGTLALGRMMAVGSDAVDRGTYYSYSSDAGATWTPLAWIEGARRGWGNIDFLPGAGGTEVTMAHAFPDPLDFCVDAAKGANVWSCGSNSGGSQVWNRLAVSGAFTIHTVYAAANPAAELLYARSQDVGITYDILDQPVFTIPEFEPQADSYDIAAFGTSTLAVVHAPSDNVQSGAVVLATSTDNGDTWTQQVIYDIKEEGELMQGEEEYQPDGGVACVYDSSGVLHVAWTNFLAIGDASNNPELFYQIDAPVMYWSEATGVVEITPSVHDTSIVKVGNQFGNLVTQPDIGFDESGNVYVMFQQAINEIDSLGQYLQHIYATGSADGGATWNEPLDITPGTGFDASFGSMANLVDDNVHLTYFSDPLAGSAIRGNHDTLQVAVMYHKWMASDLLGTPPSDLFMDDFDSYTAGMQLALQNNVDWTTWSDDPGSGEDPFVSDNYSFSGSNSVVIAQNNDLVRLHGERASGTWGMSFQVYIPAGKSGYFNTLSDFNQPSGPYFWAMEVYFDAGGSGRLLTGDPVTNFTWTEDTWHLVQVIADLDDDIGQFALDGEIIHEWQWTNAASGTGTLELDANDFFGATANDEMYMDDYHFDADSLLTVGVRDPISGLPLEYDLLQNYPNPFNPSTRITYALPEQAAVSLKIYNVLGQEVMTLADKVQEAGYHEAVWNARNAFGQPVGSGVYFYRLEATGTSGEQYIDLKKMLFLK